MYKRQVVVVATVMSVDPDCSPEICGMIGSSVALATSDIPWDGPTGSVKVGRVDGQLVINPTLQQREVSDMDMTVSGTKEAIMMVEAGANEVPEMEMLDAILFAHEEIKKIVEFIEEVVSEVGKPKQEVTLYKPLEAVSYTHLLIIESGCPCIVARGRKGGSNVAAAIVNALLYMVDESRGM